MTASHLTLVGTSQNYNSVKSGLQDYSGSSDCISQNEVVQAAVLKIEKFCQLDDKWDTYDALKPTRNALSGAVHWAYYISQFDIPAPDFFPVPNGNVQMEWSMYGLDIEIEVISISTCKIYFEDLNGGDTWDVICTSDLAPLNSAISTLASRHAEQARPPVLQLVV